MNTLVKIDENECVVQEISGAQRAVAALMKMPHYAKLGEAGVFAVLQKAKSMGMNPIEALNGGMYMINGKCEMPGQSMLSMIRSRGHSVMMDPKSTNTSVTMHGKRCDNGDTWTASFSIEDAKKAGIYKNTWEKYPQVMCMWRCVSLLGRFLFSDVIKGVYVEGEISDSISFNELEYREPIQKTEFAKEPPEPKHTTQEESENLRKAISECSIEDQDKLYKFLDNQGVSIDRMRYTLYDKLIKRVTKVRDEYQKKINEEIEVNVEVQNAAGI